MVTCINGQPSILIKVVDSNFVWSSHIHQNPQNLTMEPAVKEKAGGIVDLVFKNCNVIHALQKLLNLSQD